MFVGYVHSVYNLRRCLNDFRCYGIMQVAEAIQSAASTLRENITLRRAFLLASRGHICTYVHNALGPGVGSIGAAVSLSYSDSSERNSKLPAPVEELGRHLAMQVRAPPLSLSICKLRQESVLLGLKTGGTNPGTGSVFCGGEHARIFEHCFVSPKSDPGGSMSSEAAAEHLHRVSHDTLLPIRLRCCKARSARRSEAAMAKRTSMA
jgi:hypothetical protein